MGFKKEGENITAGRTQNTLTQSWCTPQKYANSVREFFDGKINLDPCSNNDSIVNANIEYKLPIDGLKETWNYPNIYINPPYGRDKERKTTIKNWLKKCYETNRDYNSEILTLIPVATNTSHWKEYIFNKANAICFLSDTRLNFRIDGNENNKGCPMACCIVYWGNKSEKFKCTFKDYGSIVKL